jgi:hypothetical protein
MKLVSEMMTLVPVSMAQFINVPISNTNITASQISEAKP